MKLIQLSCSEASFRTVRFNPTGLTLIIGDGSENKKDEGSSNGVGKTLVLGLVNHCLGSKVEKKLKKSVPKWIFILTFIHDKIEYTVERSGDGKHLTLNGKKLTTKEYINWLNKSGIFRLDPKVPVISFRSLFKRFARYLREDCLDPIKTYKELDFDSRLRSLYLLGLDCALAVSKRNNKLEIEGINARIKNWQTDNALKDFFRAGTQPQVRAKWLETEIPRIRDDLNKFQVAEDYRAVELAAGELTKEMREIEKQEAIIKFQLEGIYNSISQQPDISKDELLELYKGLQSIFKPEVLAHFTAVEEFHKSLAANRKARLEKDATGLKEQLLKIEERRREKSSQRDEHLQSIQGKRALDEYATIAKQLAKLEEEQKRLLDYLNFTTNNIETIQKIRERMLSEDRLANEYINNNPASDLNAYFHEHAKIFYPNLPSGIVIENNTGDNQVRYNITVQIEGQSSDGINAARIIVFDWLLLMRGANHTMDFVFHDNRLFADIDPKARASWLHYIYEQSASSGKQYIATLNTENYEASLTDMPDDIEALIRQRVTLTLRGDKPENKLLGIQFDG